MPRSHRSSRNPSPVGGWSPHGAAQSSRGALLLAAALALLLGSAAPAFGKDVLCAFQARGLSMNFGQLDPRSGLDATAVLSAATLNADMAGDCQQVAMNVDAAAGPRLLTSTTGSDAIPYTLVGLPVSPPAPGNNKYVKFTFGALILWSAYANAPAGNYQDTVIISVTP